MGFGVGDLGLEIGYAMPATHGNEMGMSVVDAMWNVDGAQHTRAHAWLDWLFDCYPPLPLPLQLDLLLCSFFFLLFFPLFPASLSFCLMTIPTDWFYAHFTHFCSLLCFSSTTNVKLSVCVSAYSPDCSLSFFSFFLVLSDLRCLVPIYVTHSLASLIFFLSCFNVPCSIYYTYAFLSRVLKNALRLDFPPSLCVDDLGFFITILLNLCLMLSINWDLDIHKWIRKAFVYLHC